MPGFIVNGFFYFFLNNIKNFPNIKLISLISIFFSLTSCAVPEITPTPTHKISCIYSLKNFPIKNYFLIGEIECRNQHHFGPANAGFKQCLNKMKHQAQQAGADLIFIDVNKYSSNCNCEIIKAEIYQHKYLTTF